MISNGKTVLILTSFVVVFSAAAASLSPPRTELVIALGADDHIALARLDADHVPYPPSPHPCSAGWSCETCVTSLADKFRREKGENDSSADALFAALRGSNDCGISEGSGVPRRGNVRTWPAALMVEVSTDAHAESLRRGALVIERDMASFFAARLAAHEASSAFSPSSQRTPPSRRQKNADDGPEVPRIDTGSMSGHMTLSEMFAFARSLAASHPSVVGPFVSLGCSLEGRHVWAFRVSTVTGGGTAVAGGAFPAIGSDMTPDRIGEAGSCTTGPGSARRIDGADPSADGVVRLTLTGQHHSREPMSTSSLLHFAAVLASRSGTDPAVDQLLATREVWVLPVVNPDGHAINERANPAGGGMQRKNARETTCAGSPGVDVNRNYGYKFGVDDLGSSPNPCNSAYRGPSPFSEPETQIMREMLKAVRPVFNFNFHSYGDLLLYPFGYEEGKFPEEKERSLFEEIVRDMSRYNRYSIGTGWSVPGLYVTNGEADDYTYGELGIYALTSEVGPNKDMFWPTRDRILPIANDVYFMVWRLAWLCGPVYNVSAVEIAVGADGDAQVSLAVRNEGLGASRGAVRVSITPLEGITFKDMGSQAGGARLVKSDGSITITASSGLQGRKTALSPVTASISAPSPGAKVAFRVEIEDESGYKFASSTSASTATCATACTGNSHCDLLSGTCVCDIGWGGDTCSAKAVTPDGSLAPEPKISDASSASGIASAHGWTTVLATVLAVLAAVAVQ